MGYRTKAESAISYSAKLLALACITTFVSSCVTLTMEPRVLVLQPDDTIRVLTLACPSVAPRGRESDARPALDPRAIRLMTWNIHKEGDAGWASDLATFGRDRDVVLLQETTLQPEIRDVLREAGFRWVMASSFAYEDYDIGVLTAARVEPIASCTQRAVEPLLRIPKSAIISWFAVAGKAQSLAVVNVHAINFTLTLGAYRAQLAALGDALAHHDGPIILAGDLNTWSGARSQALADVALTLGLTELTFADDKRTLFFGQQLDHILIRGLRVRASSAIAVTSSDHNPVTATLEWAVP